MVAFAFGASSSVPIRPNSRIASIAQHKAEELGAPIFTQSDVNIWGSFDAIYIQEDPEGPRPSTLRIAREAVSWAIGRDIKTLWVVAANTPKKPHLWRCRRDLRYAVSEAGVDIRVVVCQEIGIYDKEEWFCSYSTQERTRSAKNWYRRERILRWMPMWVYKRVSS